MRKPCKCGHRAGRHARDTKKRLPFLDKLILRGNYMQKAYRTLRHDGKCLVKGCNCGKMQEIARIA